MQIIKYFDFLEWLLKLRPMAYRDVCGDIFHDP